MKDQGLFRDADEEVDEAYDDDEFNNEQQLHQSRIN